MRRTRRTKHLAHQYDLPILEPRQPEQVYLPARRSTLRISGAECGEISSINGAWRVQSAMRLPGGGVFLGLEPLGITRQAKAQAPAKQVVFDYLC
jgi:hypothetical protein